MSLPSWARGQPNRLGRRADTGIMPLSDCRRKIEGGFFMAYISSQEYEQAMDAAISEQKGITFDRYEKEILETVISYRIYKNDVELVRLKVTREVEPSQIPGYGVHSSLSGQIAKLIRNGQPVPEELQALKESSRQIVTLVHKKISYYRLRQQWLQEHTDRQTIENDVPGLAGENKTRGGRPRYPEDEWVRQEVFWHDRNRNDPALFKEWFELAKANGRDFGDPNDSFRKILKLKPEETEETE